MDNEEKIIYTCKWFDLVEKGETVGMRSKNDSVLVLPFLSDDRGLPLMLGVLNEKNDFRTEGYAISIVSGSPEDEDPNILSTAKRELLEETGIDVDDDDRWY